MLFDPASGGNCSTLSDGGGFFGANAVLIGVLFLVAIADDDGGGGKSDRPNDGCCSCLSFFVCACTAAYGFDDC